VAYGKREDEGLIGRSDDQADGRRNAGDGALFGPAGAQFMWADIPGLNANRAEPRSSRRHDKDV